MNIDIERLKVDREYWDECGAGDYQYAFTTGPDWDGSRQLLGTVEFANQDGSQGSGSRLDLGGCSWAAVAVRPEPATEWVNGLPGVGAECEVNMHGEYWASAKVVGHDAEGGIRTAVCRVQDSYYAFSKKCVRPLKTPEQRLREELVGKIVSLNAKGCCICDEDAGDLADAILSCYSLSKKE